jgi:hypothetical protein
VLRHCAFADAICGVFFFRCAQTLGQGETAGNFRDPVPADGRHGKTMPRCHIMTCEYSAHVTQCWGAGPTPIDAGCVEFSRNGLQAHLGCHGFIYWSPPNIFVRSRLFHNSFIQGRSTSFGSRVRRQGTCRGHSRTRFVDESIFVERRD